MPDYIPAQALVPIGAIVAALLAGIFSFVSLTQSKEQKTSEFRQAWVDALRQELATFFSALRTVARAEESYGASRSRADYEENLAWSSEQVAAQRIAALTALYSIKMRLNAGKEKLHEELLVRLDSILIEQEKASSGLTSSDTAVAAIDRAVKSASEILKQEWERVKKGEKPFHYARNWAAPIVVLLCLIFAAVLIFAPFRA